MMELNILRYCYCMLRARLGSGRDDERGVVTLETVLWIGGLAVLALATLTVIVTKVTTARNNIPDGTSP
jgi:hypothetical protein